MRPELGAQQYPRQHFDGSWIFPRLWPNKAERTAPAPTRQIPHNRRCKAPNRQRQLGSPCGWQCHLNGSSLLPDTLISYGPSPANSYHELLWAFCRPHNFNWPRRNSVSFSQLKSVYWILSRAKDGTVPFAGQTAKYWAGSLSVRNTFAAASLAVVWATYFFLCPSMLLFGDKIRTDGPGQGPHPGSSRLFPTGYIRSCCVKTDWLNTAMMASLN